MRDTHAWDQSSVAERVADCRHHRLYSRSGRSVPGAIPRCAPCTRLQPTGGNTEAKKVTSIGCTQLSLRGVGYGRAWALWRPIGQLPHRRGAPAGFTNGSSATVKKTPYTSLKKYIRCKWPRSQCNLCQYAAASAGSSTQAARDHAQSDIVPKMCTQTKLQLCCRLLVAYQSP